jgi:hypothetical protein
VAVSVEVRDQRSGGGTESAITLELPERTTLRDLIRTRVREEVARHNLAPKAQFNGLVQPVDSEETLNGYRLAKVRTLDWERQADAAEEAFGRNGFFVIVGERQVEELDEELELDADTEIRFVRLTPLVGG